MERQRFHGFTLAIIACLCVLPLSAAAQTGPVAAYSFSEGTGTTVADASGNGNAGTVAGANWVSGGKFGGALAFNGSNSWVTISHSALLNLTSAMTLEAWVNPSALSIWRTVILKESTSGLSYSLYASDTASHPSGFIRRSSDINATGPTALPLNAWTHLATTYDGSTLRLFVNGIQVTSRAITGSIVTSSSPLRIGGNSIWGEYFSGLIDEVRIYNRALTATQIQTDMVTPIGEAAPGSWTIAGAISPAGSGSGATVSLSGASSQVATADPSGNFMFNSLVNGSYVVTPTKSGFSISPASQSVTIAGGNLSGVNFTATAAPVSDTTPPTVFMAAPANGTTVSSTTTVSATAADDTGVLGVQFQLDGTNLGAELSIPPYDFSWNTLQTPNGQHTLRAVARDAAGNRTTSGSVSVTVANGVDPAVVGQWGTTFDVGIVAVNMVLLHTGKVLMTSGSYEDVNDVERVWDPDTGAITLVRNPFYNVFCSGQAQLPDGRILFAGGFDPSSLGAANANIFDPVALSWSAVPNMAYRRWYPTVTGLADGRMLVMSGGTTCLTCLVDVPEIFDLTTNRFTQLTSARLAVPYYPFMYVLPDGNVLDAGANEQVVETRSLNLQTGAWTMIDPAIKDGHSSVMYRPGKILKTGTAADSGTTGNAASTAYVLDTTQPNPSWRQIASMAFPRAFQNSTILPDGNVLITGGGTALDGYDITKGIMYAEMWSPSTETWQTLSKAALARLYHSTALLLPDGRVLIAGSGDDGPGIDQRQAEIYSPPYLFKGPRPTFSGAPDLIQYGASFTLQTPDAASIASAALIRPGAVTHAFDEDQRYVPVTFTVSGNELTLTAPANANLAPPGYYMLFVVNTAGVPSVASWVHFPSAATDAEPPSVPGNLAAQGAIGAAALSWTAATDNTGVSIYNVHRATVSGFAPNSANRIAQVTGTSYTNAGLAGGTYFYVVTAQDIAGNISGASNEAGVTVFADTTAPTVLLTNPIDQAAVSGSINITATAGDDIGVVGVQFKLDGAALGAEKFSTPYSIMWNSATAANGSHTIAAVARDAAGNSTSSAVTINVSNTTQVAGGLVLALGFNEGSGTTTIDRSGSGNNGALVNGASWSASGHTGAAISFNSNGWVNIADAASLDLTDGMTLEAWVRPSSGTGWRTVVLKEATGALSYALYSANNASRPGAWVHAATSEAFVLGTAAVPTNKWTHLATTYDGITLKFFVNGVQVSSKAGVGAIAASSGPLRVGGNGIWGEYFKGLIDDVRIYNRPLTAIEIQADMATGVQ